MNEVAEKSVESPAESEKTSGAWIRAQFQETAGDEKPEEPQTVRAIKVADRPHEEPRQQLDSSLQQLAASLLKAGEVPLQALHDEWTQKLGDLEKRVSEQTQPLATAASEIGTLKTSLEETRQSFSAQQSQTKEVASEVERFQSRMDAFEADLTKRLGEISSSLENLQSELAAQRTELHELRQEEQRRTEVADSVSQVLDSLKTSVNMLGGSQGARSG